MEVPPDDRRCRAHSTRTGERCRKPRTPGSTVCAKHGSSAPQVRKRAAERVAEEQARTRFGRLADGRPEPVDDPLSALGTLAGELMEWKEFAREQIADLERLRSTDAKGTEQLDARIGMFERAATALGALLVAMAKLNIEERMARIRERQADAVRRAVDAGLSAGGVTDPEDLARARAAVVRELRTA